MRDLNDHERQLALRFAHILLPDHVTDCEPWEWNDGAWRRLFTVKEWQVAAVMITVSGEQSHEGEVTYWLYVGGEDQFTPSERRRLREALDEAEELLDALD
jgi:hypothetical protein